LSLASAFGTNNNTLDISANGALVNDVIEESKNFTWLSSAEIPHPDPNGKHVQVFITDRLMNTAFNTLYLSEALRYNTTTTVWPNKDLTIHLNATKAPVIQTDGLLNFDTGIHLAVRTNNTFRMVLSTNVVSKASMHMKEGKSSVELHTLAFSESKMHVAIGPIEFSLGVSDILNIFGNLGLPAVNRILRDIDMNIPNPYANITDSTIEVKQGYIEVKSNPVLGDFKGIMFLDEEVDEGEVDDIEFLRYYDS
jgi:hypothetical protein